MKLMAVMIAALSLIGKTYAQGQHTQTGRKSEPMQTINDITMVAPALEKYAQGPLADLWKRHGLTPRDRSIVTISALIARNQTIEMPHYFNLALDNGVKPREISEIITHLAFIHPCIKGAYLIFRNNHNESLGVSIVIHKESTKTPTQK